MVVSLSVVRKPRVQLQYHKDETGVVDSMLSVHSTLASGCSATKQTGGRPGSA